MSEDTTNLKEIPIETRAQPGIEGTKEHHDEIADALKLIDPAPAPDPKPEAKPVEPEKSVETPVEIEPPPAKPAPKPEPPTGVAKAWSAVQKGEKQNRVERAALKRDREEFSKLKTDFEKESAGSKSFKERLQADPLSVLVEAGLPFKQLADGVIAGTYPKAGVAQAPAAKPVEPAEKQYTRKEVDQQVQEAVSNVMGERAYRANVESLLQTPEYAVLASNPEAVDQCMMAAGTLLREQGELLPASTIAGSMQETWREHLASLKTSAAVREVMGIAESVPAPTTPPTEPPPPTDPAPVTPSEPVPIETISNKLDTPSQPTKLPDSMSDQEELEAALKLVPPNAMDNLTEF